VSNKGGVGKTSYFQAKDVNFSKTVGDTSKVTIKFYLNSISIDTKITITLNGLL